MTRVLSALVLIPILFGVVWYLPPIWTLVLASIVALGAFVEYVAIARTLGARVPEVLCGAAVLAACYGVSVPGTGTIVLTTTMILVSIVAVAHAEPGPGVLRDVAASVFAVVYIGLPLGALAATRLEHGRESVVLLALVIIVSDSAQYYTGRAFGRTPLAPAISPKKTREGAIGGVVFGMLATWLGGRYWLHAPDFVMVLLGAALVGVGIAGDLFESLLKRSAGVKDSSHLIPGHGGILDRIDSWLFAAPVYYIFLLRFR